MRIVCQDCILHKSRSRKTEEKTATEAAAAVATAAAAGLNLFSRQNLCSGEQDQAVLRAAGGGLSAG